MQLRVKPSAWITTSGLSPAWTLSTARIRISSSVLWSRARASRRFMPHYTLCLLTYELVNNRRSARGWRGARQWYLCWEANTMANTGIARIDDLMAGSPGVAPVAGGDPDRDAVGAIQDLLTGYGNRQLPDVRLPAHGNYGSMTAAAVQQFRANNGLPPSSEVDSE